MCYRKRQSREVGRESVGDHRRAERSCERGPCVGAGVAAGRAAAPLPRARAQQPARHARRPRGARAATRPGRGETRRRRRRAAARPAGTHRRAKPCSVYALFFPTYAG